MIYVLSGGAKAFAVIGVTYPAGSVCTCTDGTKTLTLKDTGGQGFFLIPYAAAWTVTATDGTNTKAQSVKITSEGQSKSVTLSYALELIKNGVLQNGITFTRQLRLNSTVLQISNTGYYTFESPDNRSCGVAISNAIDLTKFSALKAELSASGANVYGMKIAIINGTSYDSEGSMNNAALAFAVMNGDSLQTLTCDISELTGDNFVGVLLNTDIKATVNVYNLWLE